MASQNKRRRKRIQRQTKARAAAVRQYQAKIKSTIDFKNLSRGQKIKALFGKYKDDQEATRILQNELAERNNRYEDEGLARFDNDTSQKELERMLLGSGYESEIDKAFRHDRFILQNFGQDADIREVSEAGEKLKAAEGFVSEAEYNRLLKAYNELLNKSIVGDVNKILTNAAKGAGYDWDTKKGQKAFAKKAGFSLEDLKEPENVKSLIGFYRFGW